MTGTEWMVIAAGLTAIAWINWYFFIARAAAVNAGTTGGVQQVRVLVRGGYEPEHIRVHLGMPVRLLFDRRETSACSEEVVLPDFSVKRFLPVNRTTSVDIMPTRQGTFEFTCGMGMLRGRITVEGSEEGHGRA